MTGFEPTTFWSRTKRATKLRYTSKERANEGTRTLDLRFTKPLLYRLSHVGESSLIIIASSKAFVYRRTEIYNKLLLTVIAHKAIRV